MKKGRKYFFLFFIIIIFVFVLFSCRNEKEEEKILTEKPVETEAGERVDIFEQLDAEEIVTAMGAGWNLGNQFEAIKDGIPGETFYANPVVSKSLILAVKEQGFQSVRIPISYMSKIGPAPDYKIDKAWMDRIEQVVDWCIENDLYVIININGDGYRKIDQAWLLCDAKEQEPIREKYKAVWQQIAERYKDYDEHLIFESMNELFNGSYSTPKQSCYDNINTYNQIFLDTVRQTGGNNDKRWVLIPGWNAEIKYTNEESGFVIPEDTYLSSEVPQGENRIMISIHYYAPWQFCGEESGQITQWGADSTSAAKHYKTGEEGDMEADINQLVTNFVSQGYPCVVGEYGAIDKSYYDKENVVYRADYCQKLCRKCKEAGIVPIYWDNGCNDEFGYGLLDRSTFKVTQPEIIAAIMDIYQPNMEGDATNLILSETKITLKEGDNESNFKQIYATLEPEDCTDKVTWTSTDDMVATVNSKGVIVAQKKGMAVITAETANGKKASCEVDVVPNTNMNLRLYCIETTSWTFLESKQTAEVSNEGGTYTLVLTGSKVQFSNMGSLYIKDVEVQENDAEKSIYKGAKIKVNRVTFNGKDCTMLEDSYIEAIGEKMNFDYCLINMWSATGTRINEVEIGKTGGYNFTVADYKEEDNRLEVNFTIIDVE